MVDMLARLQELPEVAFVDNPVVAESGRRLFWNTDAPVIGIHRGVPGFTPIYTPLDADAINASCGVSARQREAMLAGSMFGFHVQAADPARYDDNGKPY